MSVAFKDVSDFAQAVPEGKLIPILDSAAKLVSGTPRLTMRRPSEIVGLEFDDSDLIIGDRILAETQSLVILGQGGLGKSRLLLQMAACQITGRPFLGITTYGRPRRWIIFQTENSNRRLQQDLAQLRGWIGEDGWAQLDENLRIHTLETDADLTVNVEQSADAMKEAIAEHKADIVCFDPLKDSTLRDLNSDPEMQAVTQALTNIAKAGNPKRAIIVLHHSLTGRAGASKATGYDKSSFGRNSKVLFNWTRAQINIAPGDRENNDLLVLACGKSNEGAHWGSFAARRNAFGIYDLEADFDLEAWESDVAGGKKNAAAKCAPETVAEILGGEYMAKNELAKAIAAHSGCCKQTAYTAIERAEKKRLIYFSRAEEAYARK